MTDAAALAVVDDGAGRVLAVSRKGDPNDLGLPGGGVDDTDATPLAAAQRELREETGIAATEWSPAFEASATDAKGRRVHVFRARVARQRLTFHGEPDTVVRWVRPHELMSPACTFARFTRRHFAALFGHLGDKDPHAMAQTAPKPHDVGDDVYQQLMDDYPPEAAKWVKKAAWVGPESVPVTDVDFSNEHKWRASHELDKVGKFQKKISKGKMKPVILVKRPGSTKYIIIDGHHRSLAYRALGRNITAYVGTVSKSTGAWDEMHASQRSAKSILSHDFDDRAVSNAQAAFLLDMGMLAPGDVHINRGLGSQERDMAVLKSKKRNALPDESFADPENRKFPVMDKAHADNAAARIDQAKGYSPAKRMKVKARIKRAQRRFGEKPAGKGKGSVRVRATLGQGGVMHVRHVMAESADKVFTHAGEARILADVADDGKPVWNQIALTGAWKGHPQGPFVIDEQTLNEIVRNFNETDNHDVAIDIEHVSEAKPTDGTLPLDQRGAVGHILRLEIRNGELWGLVDWTKEGRELVRTKKFKFFSPAILFNSKDRKTAQPIGATLRSGALTNKPFLDGMMPMAASESTEFLRTLQTVAESDRPRLVHKPDTYMPNIRRALGLGPLATAAECADHLQKFRDHFDAVGQDPEASHEGIPMGGFCASLSDIAGASPGMTWDQVIDIVEDLIHEAIAEHEAKYHAGQVAAADQIDDGYGDEIPIETEEATMMTEEEKALLATAQEEAEDATAKVAELEVTVKTLTDNVATEKARADGLQKQLDERAGKDLDAEVDAVIAQFSTRYKVEDKPTLLTFLRSNPEGFRKLHPKPEPADKAHLFTKTTPVEQKEPPEQSFALVTGEKLGQTINRLMASKADGGLGLHYDQAYAHACALHGIH